jgi:Flp pilus assembly protein TadB
MTGRSVESWCSQTALSAVAGLLSPLAIGAVFTNLGISVPVGVVLALGALCAAGAVLFSARTLTREAKRQRAHARRAISAYLDLVVLCLAGGMGIEGALHAAADIADHPITRRLAGELAKARDNGEPPWEALGSLGSLLGIEELRELAASVGLAGTEGARIRSSLLAKAASMRRHELAEAERAANVITEQLFLPGVLLLAGFLLFVGYPAYARIATGF